MMDLKMEVYSPSLVLLGMLEVWESTIWEEKAFGAGSFSVKALVTAESVELLSRENIIWIEGETAGSIEYINKKTEDSGVYIIAKGRLLTGLLDRRILWGQYNLRDTVPEIMRYLVNDCCINPTRGNTEARKMPGLVLEDETGGSTPAPTPSRLPDGYTELEYIQSDNHCSVDLGANVNFANTRFVIDAEIGNFANGQAYLFTSGAVGNPIRYFFCYRQTESQFVYGFGTGYWADISASVSGQRINIDCDFATKTFKFGSNTYPIDPDTNQEGGNIVLFSGVGGESVLAKIYSCQLYNNGTKIRDYVPCKNPSGTVGLYDLIGKSFYGNAGTGEFVAGAVVTQTKMTRTASGEKIRFQKTGGSLLETLEALGEAYQVAFGVRFNPAIPQMEFWARYGQNFTTTQTTNEPVFYSTELDDVLSSEYTYDSGDYKNVALIGGEGEGDDRTYVTVEEEAYTPPEPPTPIEPTQYTVTLLVDPEVGGVASGGKTVTEGTSITVTATPSSGFEFVEWRENGTVVSSSRNYSFTVSGDRTLTAVFAATVPTFAIVASIEPNGSGTISGAGSYTEGQTVTVTATPGEGYKFVAWRENGQTVSENAEYAFTASSNRALVAVFAEIPTSRLPEEYTEVEYIESTAPAYIKTGVKPTTTLKFVMDVEPTVAASSTVKYFAHSNYSPSSGTKYIFRLDWNASGVRVASGSYTAGSPAYKVLTSSTAMQRRIITIDYPNKEAFVDEENKVALSSVATSTSMAIINLLRGSSDTYALAAKLYSCQMWNAGELVRNFIPCISPSGAVGMFDLVEETFYANANTTGSFAAGPAV